MFVKKTFLSSCRIFLRKVIYARTPKGVRCADCVKGCNSIALVAKVFEFPVPYSDLDEKQIL